MSQPLAHGLGQSPGVTDLDAPHVRAPVELREHRGPLHVLADVVGGS
ncbi:hypothetical protein [Streptomyces sp. H34-S4]|nr:hypothetical protein [Streptomyces sp. H34-S4]MCY0936930.1 hypothetical protein [Streptomyces sp. H34-S4]